MAIKTDHFFHHRDYQCLDMHGTDVGEDDDESPILDKDGFAMKRPKKKIGFQLRRKKND